MCFKKNKADIKIEEGPLDAIKLDEEDDKQKIGIH